MQSTTNETQTSARPPMNTAKDPSGLHDLADLAASTKRRRSQRMSSQMEAQDSLLRSSAALDAVVLPEPGKEKTAMVLTPATGLENATALAPTANAASLPGTESTSKAPWLVVGLSLALVAAGAVFFLNRGGSEGGATQVAQNASAPNDSNPVPQGHTMGLQVDPSEEEVPAAADPALADNPDDIVEEEPVVPTANLEESEVDEKVVAKKSPAPAVKKTKSDDEPKVARADKPAATKTKEAPKAATKKVDVEKPAADEKAPVAGGDESLDDVLASVTGGVDAPKQKASTDTGPSKKTLNRSDVSKAMKSVSPKAKSCYSAEEFTGVVKVKYSVSPSGSVESASATGAHSSSPTGKCVAAAVKKAKFPAFSGSPMSFTFPFLLSP